MAFMGVRMLAGHHAPATADALGFVDLDFYTIGAVLIGDVGHLHGTFPRATVTAHTQFIIGGDDLSHFCHTPRVNKDMGNEYTML